GGGKKNGTHVPYYVCSKRINQHECEQDYIRAEFLENGIIQDVKTMFRYEAFLARVLAEANRRLGAEKPDLEKEIGRVEAQVAKSQTRLDRYFEAFEGGKLKPEICNQRVQDLQTQLEELDTEKRELEVRRERLELPALDRAKLAGMMDNFEEVMAAGTNPQKKDLFHKLVKKVLVHDRRTVEVWYGLPNPGRFEHWNNWLPKWDSKSPPNG
ncbi:MAG: recombinase zinc beta ribbon domain-containing protein, partial [Acidobacteriota bacterium]